MNTNKIVLTLASFALIVVATQAGAQTHKSNTVKGTYAVGNAGKTKTAAGGKAAHGSVRGINNGVSVKGVETASGAKAGTTKGYHWDEETGTYTQGKATAVESADGTKKAASGRTTTGIDGQGGATSTRKTTAENASGTYTGGSTVKKGSASYSGTATSKSSGNSASVDASVTKGSGASVSATCTDAAGNAIACPEKQ